jgi:hypothetical protein
MNTKYKFNDRVRIVSGFYSGYDALLRDFRVIERSVVGHNILIVPQVTKHIEYKVTLVYPQHKSIVCAQAGTSDVWVDEILLGDVIPPRREKK